MDRHYCTPPPQTEALIEYSQRYARSDNLKQDNFLIFLDYLGRINSMSEFSPDFEEVYVYRDKKHRNLFGLNLWRKSPYAKMRICMGGEWLDWNSYRKSERPKIRKVEKVARRINGNEAPLVLNISLDGFWFNSARMKEEFEKARIDHIMKVATNQRRELQAHWRGDKKYLHYSIDYLPEVSLDEYEFTPEEVTPEQLQTRKRNLTYLISQLKKPSLIVLSESQRPIPTCPPNKVEHLETLILQILEGKLKKAI
jgi:hypothetical protein